MTKFYFEAILRNCAGKLFQLDRNFLNDAYSRQHPFGSLRPVERKSDYSEVIELSPSCPETNGNSFFQSAGHALEAARLFFARKGIEIRLTLPEDPRPENKPIQGNFSAFAYFPQAPA